MFCFGRSGSVICLAAAFAIELLGTVSGVSRVAAHNPVDYLEVLQVEPGAPIEHGVELESPGLLDRHMVDLEGPALWCQSVGAFGKKAPDGEVLFSGYRVVSQHAKNRHQIKILDFVRKGSSTELTIQSAPEFFFSPAQRLAVGEPDPIPDGIDRYLAFRIVDASAVEEKVTLSLGAGKTSQRSLGKPLFVCLPAEEWHHDEHFEITHRLNCFVIYELDERSVAAESPEVSTLDQFGLNQLAVQKSQWLLVRGAILK